MRAPVIAPRGVQAKRAGVSWIVWGGVKKKRGQRFPTAPVLRLAGYQVNEVPREM